MTSQFSKDGKYFAKLSTNGKLKIWNACSNILEQEFTPDFHLTTPCTCLQFVNEDNVGKKLGTPKKKRRKELTSNNIILGTSSGVLLVYSIVKADLECTINSNTSQSISCLSIEDSSIVYSGADNNIITWDLQKRSLLSKWKVGNEQVSAIAVIPNEDKLLSASKTIKLWDIETKEVLKTFTGHSSEVNFLHFINCRGNAAEAYFLSGSKDDRVLNCWSLSENSTEKNAVCSFLMEDVVHNISVDATPDGPTTLAATVRSGVVHIYQHTLNGKCSKPLKPKTTVQVVSDTGQSKDMIYPIHIASAKILNDTSICIGYGSALILNFENIKVTFKEKVQCLLRKDPAKISVSNDVQSLKTHTPKIGNDVHYLTPQTSTASTKRKIDGNHEVPMEQRLENLSLNKMKSGNVPKSDNVAQLLLQGLHSKDKHILRTVLCKRDEHVIKNTVKRLPITVIIPLLEELSKYVQGKTLSSQIGSLWLKYLLQAHAGLLLSNPEAGKLLSPIMCTIENKLALQTPLNKLRGRLNLLVSQVSSSASSEADDNTETTLIYNDKAFSDSDTEGMNATQIESDYEWNENSSDEDENGDVELNNDEEMGSSKNGDESNSDVSMSD